MNKIYVKIDGIHCTNCENKIKNILLKIDGIKSVEIIDSIAHIDYIGNINKNEIIEKINNLDYITKNEYISDDLTKLNDKIKVKEFIIIFLTIIFILLLIYKVFGYNIFNVIPTIDSNITYGMLFITGILTSIHCISMCGAINLVATMNKKTSIKKPLMYNTGRLISYTLVGGFVGILGSVISVNDKVSGTIIILTSIIMFLMSLKMLGIINFKLPFFKHKKIKTNNAFIIGLLNGLMPCGPLQSMQIYALSTGSFFLGALSMFLFCLGTIPLMLTVGLLVNIIKGKRKIIINKIASILILILSLVMLNRGLLTLNIDVSPNRSDYSSFVSSRLVDNYQVVQFDLSYDKYEDILVQKDIPVKMIINVSKQYLTGCNERLIIKEYGINQELSVGKNIIEFIPKKTGIFTYTCWMGMIKNNIKVIDDKNYFEIGDNNE